MEVTTEEFLV